MSRWLSLLIAAALLAVVCTAHPATGEDLPSPAAPPEPKEMKALFNGQDLSGWEGDQRLWSIRDNIVRGETTKENPAQGNTFLIWREGELKDFDLRLSFRIERGNSGVQYRSLQLPGRGENRWIISGYQAEVENTPGKVGFLYHERGRGYLCNVGEKVVVGEDGKPQVVGRLGDREKIGATYKKSDWNDYVIIAEGNHLRHYLNGVQTVDVIDNDPKRDARSGLLALQIHAGPPMVVEFKNVRLKQYDQPK